MNAQNWKEKLATYQPSQLISEANKAIANKDSSTAVECLDILNKHPKNDPYQKEIQEIYNGILQLFSELNKEVALTCDFKTWLETLPIGLHTNECINLTPDGQDFSIDTILKNLNKCPTEYLYFAAATAFQRERFEDYVVLYLCAHTRYVLGTLLRYDQDTSDLYGYLDVQTSSALLNTLLIPNLLKTAAKRYKNTHVRPGNGIGRLVAPVRFILRCFTTWYVLTPMQYIVSKNLECTKKLPNATSLELEEINAEIETAFSLELPKLERLKHFLQLI